MNPTAYFLSAVKPNSLLPEMFRIAAKSPEAHQHRIHLMCINLYIELHELFCKTISKYTFSLADLFSKPSVVSKPKSVALRKTWARVKLAR